jgi:large subunit ribosomal protein L16
MRIPKKTKFRKAHRGTMRGLSKGARELHFGDIGLVAVEPAWITAQQIEAVRSTLSRHLKKRGRLYLRVFSDKPVSKKPAETRMGKGKGGVEEWVAVVKRERIILELGDLEVDFAKEILHSAACKLPMKTRIIYSSQGNNESVIAKEELSDEK